MLALCLGAPLAPAGCGSDTPVLELVVTADTQPVTLDVTVRDQQVGARILTMPGQNVPTRDITQQGMKIVIWFSRPGKYLVHTVGRTASGLEVGTAVYDVDGETQGKLHLTTLDPATDLDGDTFAVCPPGTTGAVTECDCNDSQAAINPAADEICGNGVDENCDGLDPACIDEDHDGVPACPPGAPPGAVCDCDDHDPNRFPGNREAPNSCPQYGGLADPHCGDGIDQDCDGRDVACQIDADCDGFSPPTDCDDTNPNIHPGAAEICGNGIDDNCNGLLDEGCVPCDVDGDTFLDANRPECNAPPGQGDCDDGDSGRNPSVTADCGGIEGDPRCALRQLCNGKDDDCDGQVDEGCPSVDCDADHDGFQKVGPGCTPPPGQVDCNDNDPHTFPGAPDRCGDGIAQNCTADLPCTSDADHDGYNADVDCDDNDPAVHPWALEICNGKDDDCDGLVDEGNPGSDGSPLGGAPPCYDDTDGLCGPAGGVGGRCICSKVEVVRQIDPDPQKHVLCPGETPGAQGAGPRCFFARQPQCEQCDGMDHDCDGSRNVPVGSTACLLERDRMDPCGPAGGVCVPGVVLGCDWDSVPPPNPNAQNPHFLCSPDFVGPTPEVCDGRDNDCDGVVPPDEIDSDGDHFIACSGCNPAALPAPLVGCGDCAPGDGSIYPGAPEVCNGRDDNCDSQTDNGACGAGLTCCAQLFTCANLQSSFQNCGGCGQPCPSGVSDTCSGAQCHCGSGPVCGGLSDNCSGGVCRCGGGPACSGSGVDRCSGGVCRCGSGGACGPGTRCSNGNCVCDGTTGCSGCCEGGNTCVTSTSASQCGAGGSACQSCSGRTDTCNGSGQCVCGTSSSGCMSGQLCQSGSCVCNGTSCPNGCCDSSQVCHTPSSSRCGTGGSSCVACSSGQECAAGVCTCDAASCPNGCCTSSSGSCVSPPSDNQCGLDGSICVRCSGSNHCMSGMCQ